MGHVDADERKKEEMISGFERVVLVLVLMIGLPICFVLVNGRIQMGREDRLIRELSTIRASIAKSAKEQDRYPENLEEILDVGGKFERSEGRIIDPFHNAYTYDAITGAVRSGTERYGDW